MTCMKSRKFSRVRWRSDVKLSEWVVRERLHDDGWWRHRKFGKYRGRYVDICRRRHTVQRYGSRGIYFYQSTTHKIGLSRILSKHSPVIKTALMSILSVVICIWLWLVYVKYDKIGDTMSRLFAESEFLMMNVTLFRLRGKDGLYSDCMFELQRLYTSLNCHEIRKRHPYTTWCDVIMTSHEHVTYVYDILS